MTGALCLCEALYPVTLVVGAQTPSMSLEALRAQGLPLPPWPGESHVSEVGLMISSGIQCPFPSLGLISSPPGSSRARNHGEMDTPGAYLCKPGRKAASLEKPLLGPDAELSLGPACHPATWTARPRARTLWEERDGMRWALRHILRQMESCAPGRKGGMCQQDKPHFPAFWDFISIRAQKGARAQFPKLLGAGLTQTYGGILCQRFWFLLGHSLADLMPSIGASNPTPESCSNRPLIQHQRGYYSVHTHVDVVDPTLAQPKITHRRKSLDTCE